jgi:hypothetical protein
MKKHPINWGRDGYYDTHVSSDGYTYHRFYLDGSYDIPLPTRRKNQLTYDDSLV